MVNDYINNKTLILNRSHLLLISVLLQVNISDLINGRLKSQSPEYQVGLD